MLSKACEYALKSVLFICHQSQSDERVGLKKIAKAINSPEAFTGKIMQQLSKSGIVRSVKGPSGGFWIAEEDRKRINIKDVVEVIDGPKLYQKCGLGLEYCNDNNQCPIHDQYKGLREGIIKLHTETSIEDLAFKLDGIATLK